MTYITLVCAVGMSTSMLMSRMEKAAQSAGLAVDIAAMPDSVFARTDRKTDILLLGPQVSYMLEEMQKLCAGKDIKIAVIPRMDYGMMDGEKVLKDALSLLNM